MANTPARPVRFLHISDTHIKVDPAFTLYGHRPYDALKQLVATINALPYAFDFILHTGDVVDDGFPESYTSAKSLLSELHAPIYYLSGNHDNARTLQRDLLGIETPAERYDQAFTVGGVQFVALDSMGLGEGPGGHLTETQLAWLRSYCTPDGPPLVVALHHQPLTLDVPWLDQVTMMPSAMIVDNHAAFWDAIRPAAKRLRAVLFGHIHRSTQTVQEGILFSSAPSAVAQLKTWPELRAPQSAPEEAPGYCLVTIYPDRTLIQQYTFALPSSA